METQEIVTVAQCFAGREFNQRELEVLTDLCAEAAKQWREQLREGVEPEDCQGVFLTASAWTALAAMSQALEASQPVPLAFTAGELSVRTGAEGSACARSLARQARLLLEPYLEDSAFAFLGVRG